MKNAVWCSALLLIGSASFASAGSPSIHCLGRYLGWGWGPGYQSACDVQWFMPNWGCCEATCLPCAPSGAGYVYEQHASRPTAQTVEIVSPFTGRMADHVTPVIAPVGYPRMGPAPAAPRERPKLNIGAISIP